MSWHGACFWPTMSGTEGAVACPRLKSDSSPVPMNLNGKNRANSWFSLGKVSFSMDYRILSTRVSVRVLVAVMEQDWLPKFTSEHQARCVCSC